MKITIEIPKEFESDYTEDRFADYFNRVKADTRHDYSHGMCGNYEAEITNMFIEAFSKAEESVSDDFTDDLLNQGYAKGYNKAREDVLNAIKNDLHERLTEEINKPNQDQGLCAGLYYAIQRCDWFLSDDKDHN